MTNIVATGISNNITAAEKATISTNIDLNRGVREYDAYIASILDKATLDLNFVKNEHKVYEAFGPVNKLITDAITTARNSTALYNSPVAAGVSAAINIPRIDYDPLTGAPLGLLVEEARTNLALQSRDFTTTWLQNPTASVAVTANATTAFDGTLTADKVIEEDTANTFHDLYQSANVTAATTYTFSMFVKAAERTKGSLAFGSGAAFTTERRCVFDLVAKTAIPNAGATAGIQEYPNGWFLIWITATADATGAATYYIRLYDATGAVTYPGVVNSGLFISDAQLEAGSYPSTRILTTTIALNRLVDIMSRTLPASNQGTIICLAAGGTPTLGVNQAAFAFTDGTSNNRVVLRRNNATGGTQYLVISGGVNVAQVNTTQKPVGQVNAFGISWKLDKFLASEDGITVMNDVSGAAPVNLTQLGIGSSGPAFAGAETLNGTIKRLVYIPQALNETEINAITLWLRSQ